MKNIIAQCNLHADRTNSATNRRAPMEYLYCSNCIRRCVRAWHINDVGFVSSHVRSNM